MIRFWNRILFLLLFFILFSCNFQKSNFKTEISFYYWKTHFKLNQVEKEALRKLSVKKIYVRFFDLSYNPNTEAMEIVSPITFQDTTIYNYLVIPTIFITNRSLYHIQMDALQQLADKIVSQICQIASQAGISYMEGIQLDCDWTDQTKDKYFKLIDLVRSTVRKNHPNIQPIISTTLRLHQFKNRKNMGMAPADEAILMCYNMGKLNETQTKNSIIDIKILKEYVHHPEKYPIPLQLALPIFYWTVVRRNDKVVHLLSDTDQRDWDTTKIQVLTENSCRVIENHYLKGTFLYKNDILRIEDVKHEVLDQALSELKPIFKEQNSLQIIFYHLDSANLQKCNAEALKKIVSDL
jgi:hypothetical protein